MLLHNDLYNNKKYLLRKTRRKSVKKCKTTPFTYRSNLHLRYQNFLKRTKNVGKYKKLIRNQNVEQQQLQHQSQQQKQQHISTQNNYIKQEKRQYQQQMLHSRRLFYLNYKTFTNNLTCNNNNNNSNNSNNNKNSNINSNYLTLSAQYQHKAYKKYQEQHQENHHQQHQSVAITQSIANKDELNEDKIVDKDQEGNEMQRINYIKNHVEKSNRRLDLRPGKRYLRGKRKRKSFITIRWHNNLLFNTNGQCGRQQQQQQQQQRQQQQQKSQQTLLLGRGTIESKVERIVKEKASATIEVNEELQRQQQRHQQQQQQKQHANTINQFKTKIIKTLNMRQKFYKIYQFISLYIAHIILFRITMKHFKYYKNIIVVTWLTTTATAKHLATYLCRLALHCIILLYHFLHQLMPSQIMQMKENIQQQQQHLQQQHQQQPPSLFYCYSFIFHSFNVNDNNNNYNTNYKLNDSIKNCQHYCWQQLQYQHQPEQQQQQKYDKRKLQLTTKGLNKYSWIFLLIYLNLFPTVCLAGYNEKRLLHDLLDTYNTLERPVLNESDPLQLSFGLTLMQIIDVDEKNQLLVTNVWLKLEWNDMNLRWNTSDYGGIKDLRIPPHRIWKPDVLMYNSADEGFDGTYQTNVVVRNNGSCLYVPPGIFKSTCKIDITWFPFDDQRCEMKFGSWTYDGFQLDLQLQDETGGDISSYVLNGEWELLGVPGKRNEIYYNCCPEPYIDITFTIIIRRRTLYYFFNLIIPCVLIASMALLGFTLPPDSGEKLSLGVTILLSLTVFLNMVAETMPATSDAVPLLGTYFNCIMFMVASSVVSTILILNYHHRNADTHEMSEWIRVVFLCWLPWILRMHRPGRPIILDFSSTPCSDTSSERKHQILTDVELKERSSKSLLANVLDIDDDFRNIRPMTPGGTLPHNPAFYRTVYGQGDDGSIGPIGSTRMPDAVTHHSCIKSSTEYELSLILKEIRFITDQLRKEDEDNDIANDWKFAAMVVDRLCLIIFTMFAILATIAVLLSAPHIIVS